MEEKKDTNSSQNQKTKEYVKPEFKYLIARKLGMTQVFNEKGEVKGVTVLEAGPCEVIYVRTKEKDGYNAVCLGFGEKVKSINKPLEGIFKKYGVNAKEYLKEFRFENIEGITPGQIATLYGRFNEGEWVDVEGISIGKGFAGAMKRHNFSGQPASHGASDRERAPGSLASRRALGRVMPGQRMAGHLGFQTTTIQKIRIVKVIPEHNIIMINGSVPGKPGSIVYLKKTTKTVKEPKVTTAVRSQTKKEAAKTQAKKK